MTCWIAFLVGIFIGCAIGIIGMAILIGGDKT